MAWSLANHCPLAVHEFKPHVLAVAFADIRHLTGTERGGRPSRVSPPMWLRRASNKRAVTDSRIQEADPALGTLLGAPCTKPISHCSLSMAICPLSRTNASWA
jgi:hypothetical protein